MMRVAQLLSLVLLAITAITLIALQIKPFGWLPYLIGLVTLIFTDRRFAKHILLVYLSIGVLGFVPINTDISISHMLIMGGALSVAVSLPYLITRYIYKDPIIKFPWHHGRGWYKQEIGYIFFTAAIAYLVLPFYLQNTGAYLNWTVEPGAWNIFKFFIGTNALGIWDELFFVSTVLALLRAHIPFTWANLLQAVLFTGFLYELGFTGWAPLLIYPFALLQGYIFKRTESLLYIVTIHLTLDLILFLALIDAHHPTWIPIFITG